MNPSSQRGVFLSFVALPVCDKPNSSRDRRDIYSETLWFPLMSVVSQPLAMLHCEELVFIPWLHSLVGTGRLLLGPPNPSLPQGDLSGSLWVAAPAHKCTEPSSPLLLLHKVMSSANVSNYLHFCFLEGSCPLFCSPFELQLLPIAYLKPYRLLGHLLALIQPHYSLQ